MRRDGLAQPALDAFAHHYRSLAGGATGMIPEADIEPYDPAALRDQHVADDVRAAAIATTAVIKLNGGLGTSMGLDRAKSLLRARDDLTFLDVIARQVLALRRSTGARLPITFLHSFRTSADSLQALAAYPDLAAGAIPLEVRQNRIPKLRADDLRPVHWPADPSLEWCPPGHGDLYPVLHATGLIDTLIDDGFTQVFVSNSDNLGALADPVVAGWFAASGAPFAIEAVPRTASDRKGGHLAAASPRRPHRPARDGPDPAGGPGGAGRPHPPSVHVDQQPVVRPGGDAVDAGPPQRRARSAADQEPEDRRSGGPGQSAGGAAGDGDGCRHRALRRGVGGRGRPPTVHPREDDERSAGAAQRLLRASTTGTGCSRPTASCPSSTSTRSTRPSSSSSVGSPTGCRAWSVPTHCECRATGRSARTSPSWGAWSSDRRGAPCLRARCWEVPRDGSDGRRSSAGARAT